MSANIVVPSLGESVSEAIIAKWFKKPGEFVKADEAICELETDKVTLEVFATASGTLKEIKAQEGDTVQVGTLIGVITEGAASAGQGNGQAKAEEPKAQKAAAPAPAKAAAEPQREPSVGSDKAPLSPAVRRMVEEFSLNPNQISGTGKDGRITKDDVVSHMEKPAQPAQQAYQAPGVGAPKREERVRMSGLRRKIAERLKQSQNTAAILTTFNEIDMSNVMALRSEYKDAFEKKYGIRLGFMSFFVKAAIAALKDVPGVNAQIDGDEIVYKNYFDIGVAVGTEQGLVVPVIRNADQLSIAEIEKALNGYAKKARDGKLTMEELTGGTFTISNGGVYGSLMSTPIINPPQSGILGMHKIEERPVAINGKVEIRPMMYVALSYDHRLIDGKESVTFLVKVKENIEDPRRLLLNI